LITTHKGLVIDDLSLIRRSQFQFIAYHVLPVYVLYTFEQSKKLRSIELVTFCKPHGQPDK
ncbi:MAG: hypothetical protein ABW094_08370, partial [Candidatus Thiodiazotropha sp.]